MTTHLRTIRAKRVKKPYLVLPRGEYPDPDDYDPEICAFATKEGAFRQVRFMEKQYEEKYWVVEASFKPLLGP